MGELITALRPFFHWSTQHRRAETPAAAEAVLKTQITALHAIETNPLVKLRLGQLLHPNPEGSSHANG
jgi:hypothetical protein